MVFDYIDGGADDEVTLRASVERFRAYRLLPDVLVDVADIDTAGAVMGQPMRLPFFISPTAASRLFHPRAGERAVARAAAAAGIAYSTSTIASTTVEDLAKETAGPKFFQVYVWKDRGLLREIMARVKAAGFAGLILTVDVPAPGNRERDHVNGFTVPPKVTPRTARQVLARPGYLWDLATTPPIGPANFANLGPIEGGIMGFIDRQFDRSVTWKDAEWLRAEWTGPLALKGVATVADARRAVATGFNAVWISNHGGRQLDTAPATIDLLRPIAEAVAGGAEIVLDGGVRRGSDIVKALALGATAVALGRAYLFGLAAGGEAGVRLALSLLETELRRTMALVGRVRIADLTPELVLCPETLR
jgi:L-lactate dehydrogenase (cytochrome)